MVEAELALDHRRRTFCAEAGEPRRHEAAVCGPGRVQRFRRRPVLEVGEDAGCHRAGEAERARGAPRVEPCKSRCRGSAAEDPADRRRMEAALVELARRGHADPGHDLVSADECDESVGSRAALCLGRRQAHGPGHRRHVADRVRVRVVEVEPVAEHGVREGGIRGGKTAVVADDRGLRLAALLGHGGSALRRHAERVRRQAAAERVEQMELGSLANLRRDVVQPEGRRELGQALCRRRHLTPSNPRRWPGTCP